MRKTLNFYCLLIVAMAFVSCEKFTEDEDLGGAEANSTLVIRTRAAMSQVDEDAKVSYPVNVYVFNGSDVCVEVATIASEADELQVALPEGSYHVYAIAGADAETYELPTKENATKESVIALKSGQTHGDLMAANNFVTLVYGEENTLTLSLERKVMMLENVTINNVPGSVTAVSVTVSPLYENLLLDGTCSGKDGSYTQNLTREGETGTWKNDAGVYMLAAAAAATVKVSFTANGKVQSYSYSCTENLEANYKVNISGTYTDDGVEMKGQIIGETWEGTKNVVFNFGKAGSEETVVPGGDDTPGGEVTGDAPEAGTIYKGCYVLRTEGNVATLMTLKMCKELTFDESNLETVINENINSLVEDLDVEADWRLPNRDEIDYLYSKKQMVYDKFDELFGPDDATLYDNFVPTVTLFYKETDNSIKEMYLGDGETSTPSSGTATNLRAFATITFQD